MNRRFFAIAVAGLLLASTAAIAANKTYWEIYCPKCGRTTGPFVWEHDTQPSLADFAKGNACPEQIGPKGCGGRDRIVRQRLK
jgi:hypothetical protein